MREVIADKSIESFINSLPNSLQCGLLIGCNGSSSRWQVVRLVPTPAQPTSSEHGADGVGNDAVAAHETNEPCPRWMAEHAKQVLPLLPGGMDIVGVYVSCAALNCHTILHTHGDKMLAACGALSRTLAKLPAALHDHQHGEILVAFVRPRDTKVLCRVVSMSPAATMLPRAVQWQYRWLSWTRVQSRVNVNCHQGALQSADCGAVTSPPSVYQLMMRSSRAFLHDASDTVGCYLVDGRLCCHADNQLTGVTSQQHGDNCGAPVQLDILAPLDVTDCDDCEENNNNDNNTLLLNKIHFSGVVHCEAFVHAKATVAETASAIYCDLRRSVAARVRMHCDSLVGEGETEPGGGGVLHELPRRVLAPLLTPSGGGGADNERRGWRRVLVSDYLYPGDSAVDSLAALRELLAAECVTEADVDDTLEVHADETAASSECSSTADIIDKYQLTTAECESSRLLLSPRSLSILLALVVCCGGVAVTWLLSVLSSGG